MKFVFLMDPLGSVKIKKDTTFILMIGADRRGHEVYFLPEGGITLANGKLFFQVTRVIPQFSEKRPFKILGEKRLSEDEIQVLFVRTDPPFDMHYLMATWLLDRLAQRIAIINDPAGIRSTNEKIWATQFSRLLPPTLISSRKPELLAFLEKQTVAVAKPTDGHGGKSVFIIRRGDVNTRAILETLTHDYTQEIVLQKFIPEADKGDKRILLLDGEPLGAVLRVHSAQDHRNNFFSGGHPQTAAITARDKEIIKILKPHLQQRGLYFVGIDILGDYLTEVNVTSPTCLQEMSRLYGQTLEDKVIRFAEQLARKRLKK